MGKKTAERIALELKDRASSVLGEQHVSARPVFGGGDKGLIDDAMSALINLGYSVKSAKPAIEKARTTANEMSLEELIKKALGILA